MGAGGTLGFRLYFAMNLLGFRRISPFGLSIQSQSWRLSLISSKSQDLVIGSPIAAGMKPVTQALCILES